MKVEWRFLGITKNHFTNFPKDPKDYKKISGKTMPKIPVVLTSDNEPKGLFFGAGRT